MVYVNPYTGDACYQIDAWIKNTNGTMIELDDVLLSQKGTGEPSFCGSITQNLGNTNTGKNAVWVVNESGDNTYMSDGSVITVTLNKEEFYDKQIGINFYTNTIHTVSTTTLNGVVTKVDEYVKPSVGWFVYSTLSDVILDMANWFNP